MPRVSVHPVRIQGHGPPSEVLKELLSFTVGVRDLDLVGILSESAGLDAADALPEIKRIENLDPQ